ncbi:MAG: ATP-grasp domain-containing protein [Pseudomonadales bacterium]|nr:ATP-grasp domain-containing protein [Pseudomonadales bacterium]
MKQSIFILSAGAEIVSLGLVEFFLKEKHPVTIVTNKHKSLFEELDTELRVRKVLWHRLTATETAEQLISLKSNQTEKPILFSSDDSTLSLLIDNRDKLSKEFEYTFASNLKGSGYDKQEFFEYLRKPETKYLIPQSNAFDRLDSLIEFISSIELPVVVKPSTKPASMDMSDFGAKAIIIQNKSDTTQFSEKLEKAWHISSTWIVQEACIAEESIEYMWGGARLASGQIIQFTAVETLKTPRMGGTTCIVRSTPLEKVAKLASDLLMAIDFVGLCEISFKKNHNGELKALELNPRPWLQINLAVTAQPNILRAVTHQSETLNQPNTDYGQTNILWISPERLVASLVKTRLSWSALYSAYRLSTQVLAPPYTSDLIGIRRNWFKQLFHRILPSHD